MAEEPSLFYREVGEQQLADISARRNRALADLEEARAGGDWDSGKFALQQIANLDAEQAALVNLHQRYVASVTPPPQREVTPEERKARPISAMDWSDILEMTRGSKYARNIQPDDPNMIAGYYEAMRRRGRGE